MGQAEVINLLKDGKERCVKEIAKELNQGITSVTSLLNKIIRQRGNIIKVNKKYVKNQWHINYYRI